MESNIRPPLDSRGHTQLLRIARQVVVYGPTGIVAVTVSVSASTTDTVQSPVLATYTYGAAHVPIGQTPTPNTIKATMQPPAPFHALPEAASVALWQRLYSARIDVEMTTPIIAPSVDKALGLRAAGGARRALYRPTVQIDPKIVLQSDCG